MLGIKLAFVYEVLGKASRPSNISVSNKSKNLIVSNTQRSSPYMAFSIESSIFDSRISLVITFELRHNADSKPVRVDIETIELEDLFKASELFKSGFAGFGAGGGAAAAAAAVDIDHLFVLLDITESPNFLINSSISPYLARGSGSTPLRVNLSESEAKHLKAPSATKLSSCFNSLLNVSTQKSRDGSVGSILPHNLVTTDMAE